MKKQFTVKMKTSQPLGEEYESIVGSDAADIIEDKPRETTVDMPQFSNTTPIPSDAQIELIKEKRMRSRKYGISTAADYLPLVTIDKDDDSRLVREDPDDEDVEHFDDYKSNRINFGDPGKNGANRNNLIQEVNDAENEIDEDHLKFEELQIGKSGISFSQERPAARIDFNSLPEPPTFDMIMNNINNDMKELKEKVNISDSYLSQIVYDIDEAKNNISTFKSSETSLLNEIDTFSDIKEYVLDLLDCLNEKNSEILEIESDSINASIKYANSIREKKRSFVEHELTEVRRRLQGTYNDLYNPVYEEADYITQERKTHNDKTIEYLKEKNIEYQDYSSEEMEEFKEHYQLEKAAYIEKQKAVFEDTHEDYSSLWHVQDKMNEWKRKIPDIYEQSYVSHSLPELFEPFVRLELITWDLYEIELDVANMEWMLTLINYGEPLSENDLDMLLVPKLIERTLFGKIESIATNIWNPESTTKTKKLVQLVQEVEIYKEIESVNEKIQKLYFSIQASIQETIDQFIFIHPDDKSIPEVIDFCNRRFWRAMKLFKNIYLWKNKFDKEHICNLSTVDLLNRKILPYLHELEDEQVLKALPTFIDCLGDNFITTDNLKYFTNLQEYAASLISQNPGNTIVQQFYLLFRV
eukprot:TRINITY_DN8407_c0_g1_i1.p1 TRINITY_DN8407_c0_g1~~TRINITY_DN8407_c0_g1_i1.p1  ORF type:complete len:748 (+),score=199.37 TRINITY_DN8407_c0_g1_i1:327-2246(+)